jgi:CRP/FNR family transcriptional regulator
VNIRSSDIHKAKIHDVIKRISLFAYLTQEELSHLGKIIVEKHFAKNEVILLEQDTPNYMYIIYSGKVKVTQISVDGKEHILAIHKKGDFFGEMSLLDRKTSPATVVAMEDSYIGLLSKNDFDRFFLKDPRLLNEVVSLLCSRLREAWLMLKVLSFAGAEDKVRAVLKLISLHDGVQDARGTIINFRLTHNDIAGYASVSRETVTRIIDRFITNDEIELIENKYILLKPVFFQKSHLL